MKLTDIAKVVRSKNAGPYELTFDIIFNDAHTFEKFISSEIITKKSFANLYTIKEEDILGIIPFAPANALKITIVRPISSGQIGERDVYGAQQHKPLMEMQFEF
ncbi:MAG: DUF4387 domain-containing protein [Defluviitaleaceae bacterium]|nr:DUF4387 domain-containing protein [Defluviitaleaceae bacterium]